MKHSILRNSGKQSIKKLVVLINYIKINHLKKEKVYYVQATERDGVKIGSWPKFLSLLRAGPGPEKSCPCRPLVDGPLVNKV